MFDELIRQIEALTKEKNPVVVGISGFGGSGKTTLANQIRDYFKIENGQTVRLDNLFAENHKDKPIFEDYDWRVISKLLRDVRSAKRLQYQGRGFFGEAIPFDEPMPCVVIVEGVRLFRPESVDQFDIAVWIDASLEFATKRGEQRDKERGADEAHVKRWETEWAPKDKEYFDTYSPQKLATFLYKEYK